MSQRHFCFRVLRRFDSIFLRFIIFGLLFSSWKIVFAQYADSLMITFDWVTADSAIEIKGKRPVFPYPVMSRVTIRNQKNGLFIHGLADTARWLGPYDRPMCDNTITVDDIWRQILEYHVEPNEAIADSNAKTIPPQPLDSLNYMVTEYTDFGVSVALAMDFSASMIDPKVDNEATAREKLQWIIDAGKMFIQQMKMDSVTHEGDRAAIVKFDSLVWLESRFTDTTQVLMTALDSLNGYTSGTGVNLGVDAALELCNTEPEDRQKAVVLLTDGRNHKFTPSDDEIKQKSWDYDVPIFIIGMGTKIDSTRLRLMAEQTGGVYRYASTREEVALFYIEVYGLLRGSYIIAHRTTDPIPNGTWRWVDIKVNHNGAIGQNRGQYYVPKTFASVDILKKVHTGSAWADAAYVMAGDTVEYKLTVSSKGRTWAPFVRVKDVLDDSLTFIDYETDPPGIIEQHRIYPDSVTWFLSRLDSGDSLVIRYKARVSPHMFVESTQLMNIAEVDCLQDSLDWDNEDSTYVFARGQPDFTVECIAHSGTPSPGYPLTLQALVTNQGSADHEGMLPVGFFIEGSGETPIDVDTLYTLRVGDTMLVEGIWRDPSGKWEIPAIGYHTVRVKADVFEEIQELDELNNEDRCTFRVGIDTLVLSVSDISLTDVIRDSSASFPDAVMTRINIWDQNILHIHRLAHDENWLNVYGTTQLGEPVQEVWTTFEEYYRDDPSIPDNPNVRPSMEVTEFVESAVSVVIAVDFSADLAGIQDDIRLGLNRFVDGLGENDWAAVVGFGDSAEVLQPFTQSKALLKNTFNGTFSSANRRLYDGLWEGILTAKMRGGRNAVLALTGGEDDGSDKSSSEIIQRAQEEGIPLFHVILGDADSGSLQSLSDETGGMIIRPSGSAIEEALNLMFGLLTNYYVLSHTSSDTLKNETWREVDLTATLFDTLSGQDTGVYQALKGILDLSIEKQAMTSTEYIQPTIDTVHYTIIVRNIGPKPMLDISVKDELPAELPVEESSINPVPDSVMANTVYWTIDSIGVGGSFPITYSCLVDTIWATADTTLVNFATLLQEDDMRPENNIVQDTVWYRPLSPPDVVPEKEGEGDYEEAGYGYTHPSDTINYILRIVNEGQLDVNGVIVEDILPAKMSFLDVTGSTPNPTGTDTLRWVINDTLMSRQREEITYQFRCRVDSEDNIHPYGESIINEMKVSWMDGTTLMSRSAWDTMYVEGVPLDSPRIEVTPKEVIPGDDIMVRVWTPVEVRWWDLKIRYEDPSVVDSTYADTFIDTAMLVPGEWKVVIPDFDGTFMTFGEGQEVLRFILETRDLKWGVMCSAMDTTIVKSTDKFRLDRNVFKPAEDSPIRMPFMLDSNRRAEIIVYDIAGGFIKTVYNEMAVSGWNDNERTTWDGRDEDGRPVGSGIYVAILTSGDFQKARKFIIVR